MIDNQQGAGLASGSIWIILMELGLLLVHRSAAQPCGAEVSCIISAAGHLGGHKKHPPCRWAMAANQEID